MSKGGGGKNSERERKQEHTNKETMGVQQYWLLLLLFDCRERITGSVDVECADRCVYVCVHLHCNLIKYVWSFVVV